MFRCKFVMILFFMILLLFQGTAYAYVDPGTGGMFYQLIILIFGVIVGYLAVFKRYIRKLFVKEKDKGDEDKQGRDSI